MMPYDQYAIYYHRYRGGDGYGARKRTCIKIIDSNGSPSAGCDSRSLSDVGKSFEYKKYKIICTNYYIMIQTVQITQYNMVRASS